MDRETHIQQHGARQTAAVDNEGAVYHRTGDVYNGPVNHQTITQDNSRTYTVPREDTALVEFLSRTLIGLLGEGKTLAAGIGTLAAGLALVAAPFTSLPAALLALLPAPSYGVWLIVVGVLLLAVLQFKADRECDECGEAYALQEAEEGKVREVDTPDGVQRETTRTYVCQRCGDETSLVNPEFVPNTGSV